MTGFGSARTTADGRRWEVEIRTVNGRALKCAVRLPDHLHGIESAVEQAVASHLARGSATVTVHVHDERTATPAHVNIDALRGWIDQLRPVMDDASLMLSAGDVLSLPGVVEENIDEDARDLAGSVLDDLLAEACAGVIAMRTAEGASLQADVRQHLQVVTDQLAKVQAEAPGIAEAYQQRLTQRMETMLAELGTKVREEDIVREVAVFAERTDIAEEISRLGMHVEQFDELLQREEGPVGRTLDFLTQEMLREANTMGSKCQDASVARSIVEIKGAIDRIKEQIQNIE